MAFTNLGKTDIVLIYGEARGYSELAGQIYCERFPQRIVPNARTFVNVAQHLRDFGRFEMSERDLGREREDRIVLAEEEIRHKIHERHLQQPFSINVQQSQAENHLVGPYVVPRRLNGIRFLK
jgi:hypothetical protein